MNLTKLLAVGRSLKESKTVFGKYKLAQQSLPRFASSVRPTRSTPVSQALLEKADAASVPPPVSAPATFVAASENPPVEPVKSHDEIPVASQKPGEDASGTPLESMATPVLRQESVPLGKRISAFFRKLKPCRGRSHFGTPVQTEWPLGQVQVVRNDLSDADIEVVVPAKRRKVNPNAQNPAGLSQARNYGYRWMKKTAGLFKTTSPFEEKPDDVSKISTRSVVEEKVKTENRTELAARI